MRSRSRACEPELVFVSSMACFSSNLLRNGPVGEPGAKWLLLSLSYPPRRFQHERTINRRLFRQIGDSRAPQGQVNDLRRSVNPQGKPVAHAVGNDQTGTALLV